LAILLSACSRAPYPLSEENGPPNRISAEHRVSEARNAVVEARYLRGLWRDTESHLSKAETSFADGEYQAAVNHAQLAFDEARLGINQSYLERAKFGVQQLESGTHKFNSTQRGLIETIQKEIKLNKGQSAYRHLMDFLNTDINNAP